MIASGEWGNSIFSHANLLKSVSSGVKPMGAMEVARTFIILKQKHHVCQETVNIKMMHLVFVSNGIHVLK